MFPKGPLYIVPDIHGRASLLNDLLRALPDSASYVFLGDLIDRGPDSLGVLQTVLQLIEQGRAICLRGNHEGQLLEILTTNQQVLPFSSDRRKLVTFFGRDRLVEILQSLALTFDIEDFFITHAPVIRYPPITDWRYAELNSFDHAVEARYDFTGSNLFGLLSEDDVVDDPSRINICGHMEFLELVWFPGKMLCLDTQERRNRFHLFDVTTRTVLTFDGSSVTSVLRIPRKSGE